MATTALYVEILVIGALAEVWIIVTIAAVANSLTIAKVSQIASAIGPLTTLLVLPMLALTYALGWIINFVSERIFKLFFEKQIRDRLFTSGRSYNEARILVLHKGSSELVHDVLFDRHIIRIARANVCNFAFLAIALLLHLNSGTRKLVLVLVGLCIVVAAVSFGQWLTRYRSHYKRIGDAAEMLTSGRP
jgi:hypothetical protein